MTDLTTHINDEEDSQQMPSTPSIAMQSKILGANLVVLEVAMKGEHAPASQEACGLLEP